MGLPDRWSGDVLSYFGGVRWTPRAASRWSPYAHLLLGGMNVTQERDRTGTSEQTKADVATWNGFAVTAGIGADFVVNPAIALRVANLEYKHAWASSGESPAFNNGLSVTMGVVVRYGTW